MVNRFFFFTNEELIIMDCALADDQYSWCDEAKAKSLKTLLDEVHVEMAARDMKVEEG